MKTKEKTAIVLGATGVTGSALVSLLTHHNAYAKIKLFSRSISGFTHPKIDEYIVDLQDLEKHKSSFTADEVYCCIGTTKAKTPNKETYKNIDYGIPLQAAKLCKENGIGTYMVISALGANASSSVFYNKIKGQMENDVIALQIPKTHILQPSLIAGKREEKRMGEWLAKQFFKVFQFLLIGSLKKYRPIHPETIAKAMVWLGNNEESTIKIQSDKIKELGEE
ncbi:MAG: NAD-dependent epimerase/dehydratase family protein [Cellulophaga sp.]|uniref:NAD-dependent epimerase/dehydratase family protein n=1 Tax=unclassified Cellulophaga TaxID=2634405 RepID=UPI0026E34F2F|nr:MULTISPECIES: NAD-dependent epimerase/dehydratase family protein [unclassified Cellulophaga]MDO6491198.1 NAD-dependent epimerase/dehydratase family protein [Cellulophaga sp. 2_MG-2023]MDO6495269.1 NAD-dependent epimerase/dehydratase family protein [Cellulophaga sp. 3_MG-2023]